MSRYMDESFGREAFRVRCRERGKVNHLLAALQQKEANGGSRANKRKVTYGEKRQQRYILCQDLWSWLYIVVLFHDQMVINPRAQIKSVESITSRGPLFPPWRRIHFFSFFSFLFLFSNLLTTNWVRFFCVTRRDWGMEREDIDYCMPCSLFILLICSCQSHPVCRSTARRTTKQPTSTNRSISNFVSLFFFFFFSFPS